jgi:hypothetical protein
MHVVFHPETPSMDCVYAEGSEQNAERDSLAWRAFPQSPKKQLRPPVLTSQKAAPAVLASGPLPAPTLRPTREPVPHLCCCSDSGGDALGTEICGRC